MTDTTSGLYVKFHVDRADASSAPGGKHAQCEHFVLDLSHDAHALIALRAYADSCEAEYPQLAADLRARYLPDWSQCHGLDSPTRVCFYEPDHYVLSNFSAFAILIDGEAFATAEAAYHWFKFRDTDPLLARSVQMQTSAHEAFKLAERNKERRRPDWDDVKLDIMRRILRAKIDQHPYVCRKLLSTEDRELVENSWRDDFWGWGPHRTGQNWLGKLWMELRTEYRVIVARRIAELVSSDGGDSP